MKSTIRTASAILATALTIQAAQARPAQYCVEYDRQAKQMQVKLSSGCVSSSMSAEGQNLSADVDQQTASITIKGSFKTTGGGRIVTADCMGRKSKAFDFEAIEPRRYSVIQNGELRGWIDFTDRGASGKCQRAEQVTFGDRPFQRIPHPVFGRNKAWRMVSLDSWTNPSANSLVGLFDNLISTHPEGDEGYPSMSFRFRKGLPAPKGGNRKGISSLKPDQYQIELELYGLLDDSVSAQRYLGIAVFNDGEWKLQNLWRKQLCARGTKAGQWTGGTCS